MWIHPPNTVTIPCLLTIRSCRFGMSIRETFLLRSTLWRVPHWCFGEYNTPRLAIAHSCWTCPAELSGLRIARHSDGTGSSQVQTGRRMKSEWIPDSELHTSRCRSKRRGRGHSEKEKHAENKNENTARNKINGNASWFRERTLFKRKSLGHRKTVLLDAASPRHD
jgi:hypothetical protein